MEKAAIPTGKLNTLAIVEIVQPDNFLISYQNVQMFKNSCRQINIRQYLLFKQRGFPKGLPV